jgi:hypothetical protein
MFEPLYRLQNHTREIVCDCFAPMLSVKDVIDFIWKDCVLLMKQAVFTPKHRPLNNCGAQFC